MILLKSVSGVSGGEAIQIERAVELANRVLEDPRFETTCVHTTFRETQNMTGEQICQRMREDIVVKVRVYKTWKWWSKVVGYVAGGNTVHMNRKYFHGVEGSASNLLHEVAHIKGFTHINKPWGSTVPYAMNFIFEQVRRLLPEKVGTL